MNSKLRTWTIFHKNEDFKGAIGQLVPSRIDEVNDVRMSFEQSLVTKGVRYETSGMLEDAP